ncbi:YceD family protein [Methylococcus capsulatus]|uniref:YceD family protein n=1 Tax=Methylococcus capsulatus TaxID=414 RepID=UPI002404FDB9|nr:YceD family protein [Methylococcus capsulatus]
MPEFVDPLGFADKRRRVVGELPLALFDRIEEFLFERTGSIRVELEFGKDGRWSVVTGWVEADLVLQCQLCLDRLPWSVRLRVALGVVASLEEADRLPASCEPLLFDGGAPIRLSDLVQDELVLAVPPIPQHAVCGDNAPPGPQAENGKRENPFAVLAQLKNNDSKFS